MKAIIPIASLVISTTVIASSLVQFITSAPVNANTNATCPSASFMNVTADPKNSAYPAPTLKVTVIAHGFL